MKAVTLTAPGGLDKLVTGNIADAAPPKAGEITVRLRASSLNYHDYVVAIGQLKTADNRIPMSDGAGEVVAVGEGVTEFEVGNHVTSMFYPDWLMDEATPATTKAIPGDTMDGYAREFVTAPARAFTRTPPEPWTSTLSPGLTPPATTSPRQAVRPAQESAAASAWL